MNTINKWDYAPEGATHHAVDADGRGWWYSGEPKFSPHSTEWYSGKSTIVCQDTAYRTAYAPHSLEARPTPGAPTMREACEVALNYFVSQWKSVQFHPDSQYRDYVEDLCTVLALDKESLIAIHQSPADRKADRNSPEDE